MFKILSKQYPVKCGHQPIRMDALIGLDPIGPLQLWIRKRLESCPMGELKWPGGQQILENLRHSFIIFLMWYWIELKALPVRSRSSTA
jgi:hypothetical protein